MNFLLDTHSWIWWNMMPEKLSKRSFSLISNPKAYESLLLSIISIWEFCKLLERNRLRISCPGDEWIEEAMDFPGLRLVSITPKIAYDSTTLPPTFHDDPADQLIVATARHENAIIITSDKLIQKYPHVKTYW